MLGIALYYVALGYVVALSALVGLIVLGSLRETDAGRIAKERHQLMRRRVTD